MKCFVSFALLLAIFDTVHAQRYRGHWQKTWNVASTAFSSANLGFAFSGYSDIDKAVSASGQEFGNLKGQKIITIGGGNYKGRWTLQAIRNVDNAIVRGTFRGYQGIAYDVEEGDAGLAGAFLSSFRRARRAGLTVIVAVSHTAPYGISDRKQLMAAFLKSRDINIISPMMYASGDNFRQCFQRGGLSRDQSEGVSWEEYAHSEAAVVPSLWKPSYYRAARSFLQGKGVYVRGYIAWC